MSRKGCNFNWPFDKIMSASVWSNLVSSFVRIYLQVSPLQPLRRSFLSVGYELSWNITMSFRFQGTQGFVQDFGVFFCELWSFTLIFMRGHQCGGWLKLRLVGLTVVVFTEKSEVS